MEFSNEPQGLESRVIYSGVTTDGEEHVEVYAEETVLPEDGVREIPADDGGVRETVADAAHTVGDAASGAAATVKHAAPGKQQLKQGFNRVGQLAQESPAGLALTGACVGFLAGMLLPTTSVDEKIGPYAEQIVDQARVAGHQAVEQGKHAMQEAAPAAAAALRN